MRLLETNGLRKRFGKREVVKGIALAVDAGETVGLLGKNGAGKTTTFRMIVGMLRAEAGKVFFKGEDVTRLPMYLRARRGMGYLAQEPSVFRGMTAEENVLAVLEVRELARDERKKRASELLGEMGLSRLSASLASTLSGGERRRLEIARALASSPSLILFDEPFTGIDPIAIAEIQEEIRSLAERGIGVLLTDHSVRETLSITDRAYIIEEGEIWLSGTPEELASSEEARTLYLGKDFRLERPSPEASLDPPSDPDVPSGRAPSGRDLGTRGEVFPRTSMSPRAEPHRGETSGREAGSEGRPEGK